MHELSALELTQRPILVTVLIEVGRDSHAAYITHERPSERSHKHVLLGLHVLQVSLVVETVEGDLRHVLLLVLFFEVGQLLAPARLVLQVGVVKLIGTLTASHADVLGLVKHAAAHGLLIDSC